MKKIFLVCLAFLCTSSLRAEEKRPAISFDSEVMPILTKYCLGCHNSDEPKGGLLMDDFELFLEGGDHGPAIVPHKADESPLVLTIEGKQKPKMPPKDNPVPSPEEVAVLRAWIDAGATGPAGDSMPLELVTPRIEPAVAPKNALHAIAHAPTGDLLAIAGHGKVDLVHRGTQYIERTLEGHTGAVTAAKFNKDGSWLVTASGEPGLFGEATIWSVADGKRLLVVKGHQDSLYAVDITADGKRLATAGYDKDIKIWDTATGKELVTMKGHNDAVFDIAFSPDGRFLASASGDRTVKLWDVATGERLDTFSQSLKEVYAVAFSPDGKRVAAGGVDNRIRVWSISESGKEGTNPLIYARFAHQSPILKLAYSSDSRLLVSSSEDQTVKLWQADDVSERSILEEQSDWPVALAFTPDNQALVVGRHDGTIAVYDAANGGKVSDLKPTLAPPPVPELLALSARGVQRGVPTKLKLVGKGLKQVDKVKVSDERLAAVILREPAPAEGEIWVEISPQDLPRGSYQVAVQSPGGESKTLPLQVDDLPQVAEADMPGQTIPTASSLPVSFWGTLTQQGEIDRFDFAAKEGETIVLEVLARTIGSKINATLSVYDEQQRVLASTNDGDGTLGDPVLAVKIPADGKYSVRVGDLRIRGSQEHFYRLSVGAFPYVTGVFPLSVQVQKETAVKLLGPNVPAEAMVTVKPEKGGDMKLTLDDTLYRFRPGLAVAAIEREPVIETEPNDTVANAVPLAIPGIGDGQLDGGDTDVDLYRFAAKKGDVWIIETEAQRRRSPADTYLEVLDKDGSPIERVWLQAVRDSYIEFRNINATQAEARVKSWEEMELNELMYLRGEVCKLFRAPRGPDSGFLFYTEAGQRRTYFDTTATTHAINDACYIVEPHPPGTELVPNGLPMFKLAYRNDDSGDRRLGSDSKLTFTAPEDGNYLVRVGDVRGETGPELTYRLVVRPPQPDFRVSLAGANPVVGAQSGKEIQVNVDRIDGFEGPIAVEITGLPPGFSVTTPIVVEAGHTSAQGVLTVAADAPKPTAENEAATKVVATAEVKGATVTKAVNNLGKIQLAEKPKVVVTLEPKEVTIEPGGTVAVHMKVERNGFDGRISFDVNNLPHGVIVDNIGLNGILIPEKQTERTFFLRCADWVPATTRSFHAVARVEGDQASPSILLHVRRSDQLAGAN